MIRCRAHGGEGAAGPGIRFPPGCRLAATDAGVPAWERQLPASGVVSHQAAVRLYLLGAGAPADPARAGVRFREGVVEQVVDGQGHADHHR